MDAGIRHENNNNEQLIASVDHIFKSPTPLPQRKPDEPPGAFVDISDELKDEAKFRFARALQAPKMPAEIPMAEAGIFSEDEVRVMESGGGKPFIYEQKRPLKIPQIPRTDEELVRQVLSIEELKPNDPRLRFASMIRESFDSMMSYLKTPAFGDKFTDHQQRRDVRIALEALQAQTGSSDIDIYQKIDNTNQFGGNFISGTAVGGLVHLGNLARATKNIPLQQLLADKTKMIIYLIQGDDGDAYRERMDSRARVAVVHTIEDLLEQTMQELLIPEGQDRPTDTLLVT